ncbi:Presequence protease: mitochondrial-like protein [Dinothrombium tinctorium]|uniref:Presequence protease, mitochondrial n=1 Tax=Dinothrombium tinctorium TaxID=1965070 RepID=A0A3S3NZG2_9ACAR|nr:Presequence protease: mitochondrial-like protein [Dinothrombium tinctorium]RWS01729.1 Presequence protease: mitochondrial-like protein [Dinothrombium tinctorium]RWS04974.1 Presequence protease: mitochondrial-like protein [Dinothrombium tinctorium]
MFKLRQSFRSLRNWRLRSFLETSAPVERLSARYRSTSVLPKETTSSIHKVGDRIHGYVLQRVEDVPELCLTAYSLQHEKSGAQHLHISRDDMNNAFAVSLRTTPTDDTGVAHILEHLTLCGSQKYPVRDPFMKMIYRSLSTFMNAMTGPDYTIYPFSTQNQKDYENLLRVYVDAVFSPLLNESDFRQEGWRLEYEELENKLSPLVFKGVVFNEMKGVFSNSAQIYFRELFRSVFPMNTYANESGGDPLSIPFLTHQQLVEFHRKHYHPSNAKFYTYGNFPLDFNLSLLNNLLLSKYERNEDFKTQSIVKNHPLWQTSQTKQIECPPDPLAPFPDRQATASISFVLENITNAYEMFILSVLSSLLTRGQNSPFYETLIASGIGNDYSPGTGLMDFTKQSIFSIGLSGIHEQDIDKVYNIIMETFRKVVENGFKPEQLEATLHLIEISIKHQTKNFGVNLIINLNPMWNHDGDPIHALQVNQHMNRLQEELRRNKRYLEEKVKHYFLNNSHRLLLSMKPSSDFTKKREESENILLKSKVEKLSDFDRELIFKQGIELAEKQNSTEDLSVLPTLNVYEDISRDLTTTNIDNLVVDNVPVQVAPQPTNKVSYFRALFKIDHQEIPEHLRPYLPLFCEVITHLGTRNKSHKDMDQEISLRTGGLSASVHIAEHHSLIGDYEQGVIFSSYSLEKNLEAMLNIWSQIFNEIKFDEDRDHLLQMIKIASSDQAQNVSQSGHQFAMTRAASSLSDAANFREICRGLSFVSLLKNISETENIDEVIEKLKQISKFVFRKQNLRCALNAEPSTIRTSLNLYEKFLKTLPDASLNDKVEKVNISNCALNPIQEHQVLPFACNFIGKAQMCVPFTHEAYSKLLVASKLLSSKFLHREIREKGGAYGGGAALSDGGIFLHYSYRDPNIEKTLEAFEKGIKWASDTNNYTKQDLNEAKLTVFQEVDKPINPGDQGMRQFQYGISDEMYHQHRLRILDVNKQDIAEVVSHYLISNSQYGVTLLGPECSVTSNNPKWKVIRNNVIN